MLSFISIIKQGSERKLYFVGEFSDHSTGGFGGRNLQRGHDKFKGQTKIKIPFHSIPK